MVCIFFIGNVCIALVKINGLKLFGYDLFVL